MAALSSLRLHLGRLLLSWAARLLLPAQHAGRVNAPRPQTAPERAPLGAITGGAVDIPAAAPVRAAPRPPASPAPAAPEREAPTPRSPSATGHVRPAHAKLAPPLPAESARRAARTPLTRLLAAARAWTAPARNSADRISEAHEDAPPRSRPDAAAQVENSLRPPRPHAPPPSAAPPRLRAAASPPQAAALKTPGTPPSAEPAAPRERVRPVRISIEELSARAEPTGPAPNLERETARDGARSPLRATRAPDLAAAFRAVVPRIVRAEQRTNANPRARPRPVLHEAGRRAAELARPAVRSRPPLAEADRAASLDQRPAPPKSTRVAPRHETVATPAAPIRPWPSLPGEDDAAPGDSRWPELLADRAAPHQQRTSEGAARHARRLQREQRGEQWSE